MEPLTVAIVGTLLLGGIAKGAESVLAGKKISLNIKTTNKASIDPHYHRKIEKELGCDNLTTCPDPFCFECFGGLKVEITIEPKERIVDGFLVPVPRGVPDEAFAWTETDPLTEHVLVWWDWTGYDGKQRKLRSIVDKHSVRSLESGEG